MEKFDLVKYKLVSWQNFYEIGLYYDYDKHRKQHRIIKGVMDKNKESIKESNLCIIHVVEVYEVFIKELYENDG